MKTKIFLLILLLAFAIQPNIHGLDSESLQAKKDQKALQHEVTVTLKLVQVFVTDKKRNPITDLTKDDFILYDNGKLQTITDFEKHILTEPKKKIEEKLEETKLPPSQKIPARMNRKFIFLLNIDRNDAAGVGNSRKAALHFLDTQVQPADEVGVFSYSRYYGLTIHEYLTLDHKKAKEAINRIEEIPGIRPRSSTEITLGSEMAKAEGAIGGIKGKEGQSTSSKSEIPSSSPINFRFVENPGDPDNIEARTSNYIQSIKELSKALRYIPGYKNIILFSGGIPRPLLFSPRQKFREDYEEMAQELATSSSPVYTVNTIGIKRDQSLELLSRLSGGKYFHNIENYKQISEQIQNITSNYYVLGYYINETWDGKYHKIKIKVNRKGCEVNAQQGYFNPKNFAEFTDIEKQLHLIDLALGDNPYFQEPLNFPLIALPCSPQKKSNLVLLSEIQLDKIEEALGGKTELVTIIFDKENNIVSSSRGEINFSLIPQKTINHYTIFSLSPGQYECRVILRNLETGKGAVASTSVEIAEPIDSRLRLYPPLLLKPEKEPYYLKTTKAKKVSETLSLIDIYPLLPKEHSPLVGELDQKTSKLLAIIRCSVVDIKKPEIDISAHLIRNLTGEKIQLSSNLLSTESKKDEDTDILLIELQLPELKAGRYSLEIVAAEATTKSKSQVTRTFIVR